MLQALEHHWPPTIDSIISEYGEPPSCVKLFLLSSGKHKADNIEYLSRLIDSFCADFIHGVSKGKIFTPKHYLLALGIHNVTGQKNPISIFNKLGHCITYPLTCAFAEASLQQSKETNILAIVTQGNETVPT